MLQHQVTHAISSLGSTCWKLILYNIRRTTFTSRACVNVLNVVKKSCSYRWGPAHKKSIFTRQSICKKQYLQASKALVMWLSRNTAIALRNHSCISYRFTHTNSVPEHCILLPWNTTTKGVFQQHILQEHHWLWQAQLGDSRFQLLTPSPKLRWLLQARVPSKI